MSNSSYSQPGFPALLAKSFRLIVQNGRPAAQALEILTMVLRNVDIETLPPLPDGWRLTLVEGNLKVEALDGATTDASEYIFQPKRNVLHRLRSFRGEAVETPDVLPAAASQAEQLRPALPTPPEVHRRRGRREYDIWEPMFVQLDALVKERGKPFETYTEAADYGLEFLKQLAKQRRKKGEGAAMPTSKTVQEKISKRRPDLVIG